MNSPQLPLTPPLVLVAELTHRCPLQCAYCSNPIDLLRKTDELPTDIWQRVQREAEALGILQLLYTGGEPLLRSDLVDLVRSGREADLYQVLITSGVGLSERKLGDLLDAGLDAVQLSLQSLDRHTAERICGGDFLTRKHQAAALIQAAGLPLILNVVLHRLNLHEIPDLLQFAWDSGAERIELANSQYYGWALANREVLLPDVDMLQRAEAQVEAFRQTHSGLAIQWVVPDYHDATPKPCMGGWASTHLIVGPDGRSLPCPAAYVLPELSFPNVRDVSLREIWFDSSAFNAYRGTAWMQDPCRSCPRQQIDYGGCRCQAYLLTGDASATDPVCRLSPFRATVDAALQTARATESLPLKHRPRTTL